MRGPALQLSGWHVRPLAQLGDRRRDCHTGPVRLQLRAAGLGAGLRQVLGDQVREPGQVPADLDYHPHRQHRAAVPRVGQPRPGLAADDVLDASAAAARPSSRYAVDQDRSSPRSGLPRRSRACSCTCDGRLRPARAALARRRRGRR
ncbi:hypothetical protein ACFU7Y_42970 [Kitasatospora sp. NPDC057542]|uniref:hypothetical protein n=1 Tax=Kitasatospora sp. NPDC057542 TaxID=3346162 RepID=UPI0036B79469